jgi:hypothetical protein
LPLKTKVKYSSSGTDMALLPLNVPLSFTVLTFQ